MTPILLGLILNSACGAMALTLAIKPGISTVPIYSPQVIVNRRSVRSGTNSVGPRASWSCSSPSLRRGAMSEARGVGRIPSETRTKSSSLRI